ncbi:MAG: hypothetical protein EOO43_17985 [Flavobacterium sp.]|nr:MAG: hypothetical protein EOO43_17985 [Flavobacterium sp.]
MSYRDKTYVIFDGDNDMWAYAYMKGWKKNDNIDFNFEDAHDIKPLTYRATDEYYVKGRLRERMKSTCQVIVLVGESTRFLYKYVRWEIELALELNLPIIVVNLNNQQNIDYNLCPPILRLGNAMHVPFKLKIIRYSLDNFPHFYYYRRNLNVNDDYNWNSTVYKDLGL